jgi:hypothetical protein
MQGGLLLRGTSGPIRHAAARGGEILAGEELILSKVSFGSKWGRVSANVSKGGTTTVKTAEDVVRELKKAAQKPPGEDYRERSIAIHGLVCALCGREFTALNRQLLTVHHKDGNHQNNPPDGSNWENLCVYCHEDIHSRGVLGDYLEGSTPAREVSLVFRDDSAQSGLGSGLGALGEKLKKAMTEKQSK